MTLKFNEKSIFSLPERSDPMRVEGEIKSGEIVGLRGPSGCGKSTLLRHIAQVGESPFSFEIDGEPIDRFSLEDRRISLVFQKALLLPHLNVRENLRFPLRFQNPYRSWSRELQENRVDEFLQKLSLSKLAARDPSSLSGGEAMRVAILRALLSSPRCLLLDEAFSSLDKETKAQVKAWLLALIKELGIPTLLVAHVTEDLDAFADRSVDWPTDSSMLHF